MIIKYIRKIVKTILKKIWTFFLHGLFTILPIAITVGFFYLGLEIIKNWLKPLQRFQPEFLQKIPYSEVIVAIIIILLIGSVLRTFIVRSLMGALESVIFKIPLVKPIYSGIKQLVHALNPDPDEHAAFTKVVMIEFPLKGTYSLGFMTTEVPPKVTPLCNKKFFNIFVPTTPNPTTGYFIMVEESDLIVTPLTRQEAMAMIISGGIIQPKHLMKKNSSPSVASKPNK